MMFNLFDLVLIVSVFLAGVCLTSGNTCASVVQSDSNPIVDRKVRWAIVALTKHGPAMTRPRDEAMVRVISPFASKYDVTVIFFSEVGFPETDITEWQNIYKNVATVKVINTAHHGFSHQGNRFGYKYMCKFFALDIYTHLKDYDYYLRCDTDCKIKGLNYDLFDYVTKNKIEYGYALRKLEAHKITRETLPVFTENYLRKCGITASAIMDQPLSTCFNFYNNFHIGKVSFFLRPDVQHYLHAVNDSGRIFSDRWGDSTIQAYAVRVFMNPERIKYIPNFSYIHGSHNGFVSTFAEGRKSNIPQALPLWDASNSKPAI